MVAVLKAEIRKPTLAEHRMHDKVTKCIAVAEMDSTLSASSYGVLYEALNTTSTSPHIAAGRNSEALGGQHCNCNCHN